MAQKTKQERVDKKGAIEGFMNHFTPEAGPFVNFCREMDWVWF